MLPFCCFSSFLIEFQTYTSKHFQNAKQSDEKVYKAIKNQDS